MSDISSIEPQQIDHNNHFLFTTIMMKPLSPAQCNHILSLLDAGQSAHQISSKIVIHTSTITRLHLRHHPHLHKSSGGHPSKLSPADIHYAPHLIGSRKAENAAQITKTLQDIKNKPLFSNSTLAFKGVCYKVPKSSKNHLQIFVSLPPAHTENLPILPPDQFPPVSPPTYK